MATNSNHDEPEPGEAPGNGGSERSRCRAGGVIRARLKTDWIACAWLIRRFIDPDADILYVPGAVRGGVLELLMAVGRRGRMG